MASGDEAMRVAKKALATAEKAPTAAREAGDGVAIGAEASKHNERRIARLEKASHASGGRNEVMARKAMKKSRRFLRS